MLDLPGHALLDKQRLIGGCIRLRLHADAARLRDEVARLPEAFWGTRAGRGGVHAPTEAVFLRGFAPTAGEKPIDDRPALQYLPYARELIHGTFDAEPQRALVAKLLPDGVIAPHTDLPPYFGKTIRLHVPVVTNDAVWLWCADALYRMQSGEIWALNNSATHAVWNGHARESRIHLICDFLPSPRLLALLADGGRDLGTRDAAVEQRLLGTPAAAGVY